MGGGRCQYSKSNAERCDSHGRRRQRLCDDPPLHLALRILALGRNRVDLIDEDLNRIVTKSTMAIKLPYTESARLNTPTAAAAFAPPQRRRLFCARHAAARWKNAAAHNGRGKAAHTWAAGTRGGTAWVPGVTRQGAAAFAAANSSRIFASDSPDMPLTCARNARVRVRACVCAAGWPIRLRVRKS